jgi:ssDNA-binding Zn-finger/Zn-ribbon topoisomerase 1
MTADNAIVTVEPNSGFITPSASVADALHRYQDVKDFIDSVLRVGVDYGTIPGASKPALFKAGAEKMCSFFGLQVHTLLVEKVEDWMGTDHGGEPFFYYRYQVGLYRGDLLIAQGEGSCNSWEVKYRYRKTERVCPKCGKSAIIKGKDEFGGGWLCWTKKDGCGAKFADTDAAIVSQQAGQIKNPDPADLVNTLQKMGQKRALVAPVLIATNTSDYFTQDIEDFIPGSFVDATVRPAAEAENQDTHTDVPASTVAGMYHNMCTAVANGEKITSTEFWKFGRAVPFDELFLTETKDANTEPGGVVNWRSALIGLLDEWKANPANEAS